MRESDTLLGTGDQLDWLNPPPQSFLTDNHKRKYISRFHTIDVIRVEDTTIKNMEEKPLVPIYTFWQTLNGVEGNSEWQA